MIYIALAMAWRATRLFYRESRVGARAAYPSPATAKATGPFPSGTPVEGEVDDGDALAVADGPAAPLGAAQGRLSPIREPARRIALPAAL